MQIISSLPERKHYTEPIAGTERWPYQWQDKATPYVRVVSVLPNPWLHVCLIKLKVQLGKSYKAVYPLRLDLQCSSLEDAADTPKASIIRELDKGRFAYSRQTTLAFFAFESVGSAGAKWLMYSVIAK